MKNGPYFFSNSPIFHQSAFISKGKHCLLSRHDYFDYNSTDFSQFIEKTPSVGGVNGHRFAII